MFGLSGGEILFIALIALILFGNEKLPENVKKMFHGLKRAKKFTSEVQRSWQEIKIDVEDSVNKSIPKIYPVLEKQAQPLVEKPAHEEGKHEIL